MELSSVAKVWLKSGAAAFIAGGSTAASSWGGLAIASASGVDVPTLNAKGAMIIFLAAGVHGLLMYLKQSPLPGMTAPVAPSLPGSVPPSP